MTSFMGQARITVWQASWGLDERYAQKRRSKIPVSIIVRRLTGPFQCHYIILATLASRVLSSTSLVTT
jgi:hypothetical protein